MEAFQSRCFQSVGALWNSKFFRCGSIRRTERIAAMRLPCTLKVEYRIDISAVADPPVAIMILFSEMIRFRSLHRTSIRCVSLAFPSSMCPSKRPNTDRVGGERSLIWSASAFAATFSFLNTTAEKSSSSQLGASSKNRKWASFAGTKYPCYTQIWSSCENSKRSAIVTVRTPCPARARRLSRRYQYTPNY